MIRIGVDSGAEVSVWPAHLHPEVETVVDGTTGSAYFAPGDGSKGSIIDEGQRRYRLESEQGSCFDLPVRVAQVRRPLASVAELNDVGWDIHFMSRHGAWGEHVESESFVNLHRYGNRFDLLASVCAAQSQPGNGKGRAQP